MLVSAEQLPSVLALLRGSDAEHHAAEQIVAEHQAAEQQTADDQAAAARSAADSRPDPHYSGDPVAKMTEGYPEEEGPADEDAWNLTDRD